MAKKILIAEDERPIAQALYNKLKSEGFEPKLAHNGQEALDLLTQEKVDLILLDLMMPVVDGFGVMAKLKENNDQTPIIVLSNLGQESDIQKAMEMGAKNFYVKADTPLLEVIKQINGALGG